MASRVRSMLMPEAKRPWSVPPRKMLLGVGAGIPELQVGVLVVSRHEIGDPVERGGVA